MKRNQPTRITRAFTLIELLVVIAIIAILAAILFPVFATVRESARQSSTMSNMHTVYLGARLFYEDEGHYPSALFGYAEIPTGLPTSYNLPPAYILVDPTAKNATPMDQATENFSTLSGGVNKGYLYREQVKDFNTFVNPLTPASHQQDGKTQLTAVTYPHGLPLLADGTTLADKQVVWSGAASGGTCPQSPDADTPRAPTTPDYFIGKPKVFYKMDSMDIGPKLMLDNNGNVVVAKDNNGNIAYELHYSPDWTKERYNPQTGCDAVVINSVNQPITTQLKYKNPPTERTILTYNTDHVAFSNSNNILILLLSGTARTMNAKQALDPNSGHTLPLGY